MIWARMRVMKRTTRTLVMQICSKKISLMEKLDKCSCSVMKKNLLMFAMPRWMDVDPVVVAQT